MISIVITNNGGISGDPEFVDPQTPIVLETSDGQKITVLKYGSCFGWKIEEGETLHLRQATPDDV